MKRAARWTSIGLAGLFLLVVIFYAAEDWRGKRAWEKCEARLKAQGETLDWSAYIPPPVPDNQNFFTAPKMHEWFIETWPPPTNELTGLQTNENTYAVITNKAVAGRYLTWSDKFESDFELIREALKRPYARMDGDYSEPIDMPMPNFVAVRAVVQTLSQRARCHLLLGQPAMALNELTLVDKSRRLLETKPMSLIATMVNGAIAGLYADAIGEGLRSHAWRKPQLITLQGQLKEINLAPLIVNSFRIESAVGCSACKLTFKNYPHDPSIWENMLHFRFSIYQWMPRGWAYQNMVTIAEIHQEIMDSVDLTNHLILPQNADTVEREIRMSDMHSGPYTFLAAIAIPDFAKAEQFTAYNQTLVNEARVACVLERYRLANNQFPQTLKPLVPQFIEKLPHDIIGGQPLHYRLTGVGTFLLYSIGWNEKDDGGQNSPRVKDGRIDNTKGDWVWKN